MTQKPHDATGFWFTPKEMQEHNAVIRKAEREQVLNRAIEKWGEWFDAGFERPIQKQSVVKLLESLRGGATDEGGSER